MRRQLTDFLCFRIVKYNPF